MSLYLLRRLIQAMGVMAIMSLIVFLGVFAIGDPVEILISPDADQIERERAVIALGLDKPLWQQYLVFLGNALRGDLGRSFVFNEPALQLILSRMPATLELAFGATIMAIIIGLPLGLYAPHAAPYGAYHPSQRAANPPLHFSGCAARERQQQHTLGVRLVHDEIGHAVRQRIGLAATGTGNNQQGACVRVAVTQPIQPVADRQPLLGIERFKRVGAGFSYGRHVKDAKLYINPVFRRDPV